MKYVTIGHQSHKDVCYVSLNCTRNLLLIIFSNVLLFIIGCTQIMLGIKQAKLEKHKMSKRNFQRDSRAGWIHCKHLIARRFDLMDVRKRVDIESRYSLRGTADVALAFSLLSLPCYAWGCISPFCLNARSVSAFKGLNNFVWHIEVGLGTEAGNGKCENLF